MEIERGRREWERGEGEKMIREQTEMRKQERQTETEEQQSVHKSRERRKRKKKKRRRTKEARRNEKKKKHIGVRATCKQAMLPHARAKHCPKVVSVAQKPSYTKTTLHYATLHPVAQLRLHVCS